MVTSAISRMGKSPEEGIKAPVLTSTTVNIVLSGTGQILNGITTGTKDRVLVKDQTVPAENGTYNVGPDAWERTTDMNAADDLDNGMLIVDANTNVVYSIQFSGVWSPGATALSFVVLIAGMPASIVFTANFPIDLVDVNVALVTGALDPTNEQHLEYDFDSIQSKSNATTAAVLNLNPLGGDVVAAGVSVTAHAAAFVAHAADATIHYTQASISITESQISDLQAYALSSALTAHTGDATIHFTVASISITESQISDLQAYALASALTSHTGDATIHFTVASISITASQVSDFATAVGADAAVAANTAKISYTDAAAVSANTAKVGLNTSTTAALEAIANAINTDAAKELGYMVLNTDTGLTVFASGNADGSVWHFYDESLAHTPV